MLAPDIFVGNHEVVSYCKYVKQPSRCILNSISSQEACLRLSEVCVYVMCGSCNITQNLLTNESDVRSENEAYCMIL